MMNIIEKLRDRWQGIDHPFLVHSKSRADRTGFFAALYLVDKHNDILKAKSQLSLKFFHNK